MCDTVARKNYLVVDQKNRSQIRFYTVEMGGCIGANRNTDGDNVNTGSSLTVSRPQSGK